MEDHIFSNTANGTSHSPPANSHNSFALLGVAAIAGALGVSYYSPSTSINPFIKLSYLVAGALTGAVILKFTISNSNSNTNINHSSSSTSALHDANVSKKSKKKKRRVRLPNISSTSLDSLSVSHRPSNPVSRRVSQTPQIITNQYSHIDHTITTVVSAQTVNSNNTFTSRSSGTSALIESSPSRVSGVSATRSSTSQMASTTSHHSDLEDQVRLLLQQHDQEMNQQQQNQQTPNDNTILDDNVPKESATSSVHPSSSVSNIPVSPENLNSVPNTNPSSSQASHSALQPYQNSSIGTSTSHASTSLAQNSSSDRGSNLDHSSRTPPSDRASNLDTSRHGVHAFFGDLISSPGLVRADLDYDDDDYQELRNITGESTSSANYGGEFTGEFSEGESEDELEELNTEENKKESENLLTLLYSIAEDQARKDGFVHRSITCNHCTTSPIRGFRYKCLNCVDFDLCESCEALNEHIKTHVFIKIRIPIPPLMNPRSILLGNLYPGKEFVQNGEMPEVIGTHFDKIELEAFYAQYLSLSTYPASSLSSTSSPSASGITKPTFLQCLGPLGITQNLISDRIFAFFDRDKNGVIDFEEFCHGLSVICKGSLDERIKYAFEGYDLDANGIITKSELRKMFKAYFYLSMELVRDVVKTMEEGMMESFDDEASRPVSSAFLAPIPTTGPSNHDESNNTNKKGKEKDDLACLDESPVGDYLLEDGERSPKRKLGPIHLDPYSPLHLSLQDPSPLIHLLPPLRRRSVQMSPLNPIIDSDLEEEHWPVMETMSQDAIEEMVERTFNSAGLSDEDGIDFEVFKKVVEIDSNLLAWFEALGSVF